ncbi:MAG: FAD:protein FMN transferase [Heyndrickxia sp.]
MYSFKAMNTTISTFYLDDKTSFLVEAWFRYSEDIFSRFLPESELSELNRSNGKLYIPSTILFDLLVLANQFYKETEGIFNPFLCEVISRLGYDRSFEKLDSHKIKERKTRDFVPLEPLLFDMGMKSVQLTGASIDLGGIAKGWTAQQIAYQLQKGGKKKGGISAGGDIAIWGEMAKGWNISIAHPLYLDKDLFSFNVYGDAGIATSSTIKRSWKTAKGNSYHHIIDPRSLQSSESDLIQVTVLAPDLTAAEVYAKCIIILGWDSGLRWLAQKQPQLGVIGVKSDLSIHFGGSMNSYCPKGVKLIESTIS